MSAGAVEQEVLFEERALQAAMLASDVDELDRLLQSELLAVEPDGQMIDKDGDLDLYIGAYVQYEVGKQDHCKVGSILSACGPEREVNAWAAAPRYHDS